MMIDTDEYRDVGLEASNAILARHSRDDSVVASATCGGFTQIVATASANKQAHDELDRHAQEQAAMQRVATLVAQGTAPAALFAAVSREVEALFDAAAAAVVKFLHDPPGLCIVGAGDHMQSSAIGSRCDLAEDYASTAVYRTGRSARREACGGRVLDGPVYGAARDVATNGPLRVTCAVASPLTVAGQLWGAICVSAAESLPDDTEARLEHFADIIVTAIANADSRQALASLAAEQACLRRIATQVARELPPEKFFGTVTQEIADIIGAPTALMRFDREGPSVIVVGTSSGIGVPAGTRWNLSEVKASAEVYRTERPARVDDIHWHGGRGGAAETGRRLGVTSQVAIPIVVDGSLWGAITVNGRSRLPVDVEQRMERFTELVALAIANAQSKYELAASRRRIVEAGDEARRRIERNLHDGTQQRLVSMALAVRATEADLPADLRCVRSALSQIAMGLEDAVVELQEITRGVHPASLEQCGLGAALRTLARRSPIPVELDLAVDGRLPEPVEVAVYYVVSEAFANATKHAQATCIDLSLRRLGSQAHVSIRDDGIGGANPARGSGLVGLTDRLDALGGSLEIRSPQGHGTRITAMLPLDRERC